MAESLLIKCRHFNLIVRAGSTLSSCTDQSDICMCVCLLCTADCSGPVVRGRGSLRRPADIPPIDPSVLLDLHKHTQEVAQSVEMMLRSLNGTIQNVSSNTLERYHNSYIYTQILFTSV